MRRLLNSLLAVALVLNAVQARAIVIEGTTPSGQFKAVGLDSTAAFRVSISTGVAYHVVTDTGSVTMVQGPVEVSGNASATPVPVSGAGGGPIAVAGSFTVSASTSGTVTSGQLNHTIAEFTVLAVSANRKQSIVCNNDPSLTVWLGGTGVTTATGIPLGAGGCMSPDVPSSFTGLLRGISTAAAVGTISYISFE